MKHKHKQNCEDQESQGEDTTAKQEEWFLSFLTWIRETTSVTDWLIVACTIVIALIGFSQWRTLDRQSGLLEQQLKDTAYQFNASHRPWCALSGDIETVTHLRFEGGKVKSSIGYSVKNSGMSPAFRQTALFRYIVAPMNQILGQIQGKSPCDDRTSLEALTSIVGHTILPGETIKIPPSVFEGEITTPISPNTKTAVVLNFCIAYRDQYNVLHATGDGWSYVGDGNSKEFLPVGEIPGYWRYFGFASVAY